MILVELKKIYTRLCILNSEKSKFKQIYVNFGQLIAPLMSSILFVERAQSSSTGKKNISENYPRRFVVGSRVICEMHLGLNSC